MRPLTSSELEVVFKKFEKFLGTNLMNVFEVDGVTYVLRLHRERVYYGREDLINLSVRIPRKQLISMGTCLGKFTKTKKFRILVTCMDFLARHSKHKVWLSSAGEQSYVYGNHVIKRYLARITENTPKNSGVVVLSPSEIPLGFGVTSKSTEEMRSANTEAIVVFHQADIGEYLRDEADLV